MSIKVEKGDSGQVVVGGTLNEEQKKAIASVSVSPSEIFEQMDQMNADIEQLNAGVEEEPQVRTLPQPNIPTPPSLRREEDNSPPGVGQKFNPHDRVKPKGKEMDLDNELESMGKKLDETEVASEAEAAEDPGTMRSQIMDLLKSTPGSPDEAQINAWKAQYGENGVHVMALGEGDVYIFTHLRRGQWQKIQEITAKAQQAGNKNVEDDLKERVIQYSVLWPHPLPAEFIYNSRAGVVDSLYEMILLNSYFLSPQQAIMLTTQL